jgi:hypothetical protein
MTALVNLAVAETNTAYSRSAVIPRVRLVYSGEVAGYTEAGDFSGCPRIQNFSNPNVTYNGFPTGVPLAAPNSADAAASLNANNKTK